MSKSNFFKFAAVLMLVVNVMLVTFILTTGPQNGGPLKSPKALNLDKDQDAKFAILVSAHINKMEGLNTKQKDLLVPIFLRLFEENSELEDEQAFELLEGIETEKIRATYDHFLDVKSILKSEQYDGFDFFVEHALERILYGVKKGEAQGEEIEGQ